MINKFQIKQLHGPFYLYFYNQNAVNMDTFWQLAVFLKLSSLVLFFLRDIER